MAESEIAEMVVQVDESPVQRTVGDVSTSPATSSTQSGDVSTTPTISSTEPSATAGVHDLEVQCVLSDSVPTTSSTQSGDVSTTPSTSSTQSGCPADGNRDDGGLGLPLPTPGFREAPPPDPTTPTRIKEKAANMADLIQRIAQRNRETNLDLRELLRENQRLQQLNSKYKYLLDMQEKRKEMDEISILLDEDIDLDI